MPSGPVEGPLHRAYGPGNVAGGDIFPDLLSGDEIDRRISSSETRTKFWVIACVASNLILAIPVIFYMGQMSQSVQQMATAVTELQANRKTDDAWVRDRMVWEAQTDAKLSDLQTRGVGNR